MGDGIERDLPFNNGGNVLEAANMFIAKEGCNPQHSEEIQKWIRNQSLPYATRNVEQNLAKDNTSKSANAPKCVPMPAKCYFDAINVEAPKKKLMSFEEEFKKLYYPVQFNMLMEILSLPPGHGNKEIGTQ